MENIDFLKTLLINQQDIYSDFSGYALAIVGVVAAGQFIYSVWANKKETKFIIDKASNELESKIQNKVKDISEKSVERTIITLKKEYRKEFDFLHWETCRSLALHANKSDLHDAVMRWWLESLIYAIRADIGPGTRITTNAIIDLYNSNVRWNTITLRQEFKEDVLLKELDNYPHTLNTEKVKILKILEEIKEARSKD